MTKAAKTDAPRGWPLAPGTVRAVLNGHGILGLAFAALIYLVCLTGTLAVFAGDIARWEAPGAPVANQFAPGALDRAVRAAQTGGPAQATLYLTLPSPAQDGARILAYTPTEHHDWAIARDGTLTEQHTPFSEFLIDLHIALHLPRTWGAMLVGLTGVALLSVLISGILAHPRVFKDAFSLRRGGARRLQEADLHNRLGTWALPFHVTIALTGAILGLTTLIVGVLAMLLYGGNTARVYGFFFEPPPAANAAAQPLPALAPLLLDARRRSDGAAPQQLMIERAGRADARIAITSRRDRLLVPQDTTVFDARGRMVTDRHPADLPAGVTLLGGIGQLHFGWFGGLPVRLLYGLLGLALCLVTSSGVTIWLARRRDRGRAVPLWERLWTAVAWGQPVALALTAAASLALPAFGDALIWLWLALTLALLLAAGLSRRFGAAAGSIRARQAVGGTLLGVALFYLLMRPVDLSGLGVEAALLLAAALLLRRPATHRIA